MSDDQVEVGVVFDVDRSSVRETKSAVNSIKDTFSSLEKGAQATSKSISGSLGSAGRLTRGLGISGGREIAQLSLVADSLGDMASGAKRAVKSIAGSGGVTKSLVAMGVAGVAAAGALAIVVVAMKSMIDASAEQARGLEAVVSTQRELNKEIAAGLTTEGAQRQIDEITQAREDEEEILSKLKDGMDDLEGSITGVGVTIAGQFFPSIKELNKQIAISDSLVKGYSAKLDGLNEVIDDGSLAANDAKVKEEVLAKIREEKAEKAAESLERAEEAQAQAAEKAANANRKYGQAVADVAVDLARAQTDARRDSAIAIKKANADALADTKKAVREFNDERLEADIDFFEESKRNRRENMRALRDIIRDGTREQKDLLASRNFLAIDQNTKDAKRALEDVAIAAADEREERNIAAQEQLEEMKREFQNESRERRIDARKRIRELRSDLVEELRNIQTASNRKLKDLQTSLNRELTLAAEGLTKKLQLEEEYWSRSIGRVQQALGQLGAGSVNNFNSGGNTNNVTTNVNGSNLSTAAMKGLIIGTLREVGVVN